MPHQSMVVVDPPVHGAKTILEPFFIGPAIKGIGRNSYRCGSCGTVLLESVHNRDVLDIVVKCARCGNCNEPPLDGDAP